MDISATRKILISTAGIFAIVVIITFIGFKLGYDGLLIVGTVEVPLFLQYTIQFIIFILGIIMIFSIVLNIYGKAVLKIVVPYLIMHGIICSFYLDNTSFFISGLLPIIYPLTYAIIKKDFKASFLRLLALYSVLASYQILALMVKTGSLVPGYNHIGFYQELVFAIDLLIFILIFYCIGGEKFYADKYSIYTQKIDTPREDLEDDLAEAQFRDLTGFRKVKAVALLMGFQLFQWIFILLVCAVGNVIIEGLVVTLCFVTYGFVIKRRWHSDSLVICTATSSVMFYISAKIIPSFGYSQLFPVLAALFLAYALYLVAMRIDSYKSMKEQLEELLVKQLITFSCATATEEEIKERCLKLGKSNEYINFCILAFRSGLTRKQIAAELHLSEFTVKEYKRIRKKELERIYT